MKNLLYEYPLDSLLTTDEWDHMHYLIGEELKSCEVEGGLSSADLPFILYFEGKMKEKLIKAGFKKDIIDNQKRFRTVLEGLENQGTTIYGARCGVLNYLPFAYGYPADVVTLNDDKSKYWIKPDIEAALRSLESITIIKGLLVNDGLPNKEAIKVYLRSLELIINLSRAGNVPKLAVSEAEKKEKSLTTRELKKEVMRCIIDNIFKKNPHRPKTLGEVWNRIGTGYEGIRFIKTKKDYIAKTGKNAEGKDIVIITEDGLKNLFEYKKRSLQHFIDELKKQPSHITQ